MKRVFGVVVCAAMAALGVVAVGSGALPASAAVSPVEQWVTAVSGTPAAGGVITFGTSGVTAQLSSTTASCVGTNSIDYNSFANTFHATDFLSPTPPTTTVGVNQCLVGGSATRTVTFNQPVSGLIFHIVDLDASKLDFAAAPGGGAIQLSTVNKNAPLQLTNSGTELANSINTGSNPCTDDLQSANNPGCGSFHLTEDGGAVSSFSFTNTEVSNTDGWYWSMSFRSISMTKQFSPATVAVSTPSTLIFSIQNPADEAATRITGGGFTDALPAGLSLANGTVSTSGCRAATVNGGSPARGDTSVVVAGASIDVGVPCTISVQVASDTVGSYLNDDTNLTSALINIVPNASATLDVTPAVAAPAGPALASTGADAVVPLSAAVLLVLLGAGLLVMRTRARGRAVQ